MRSELDGLIDRALNSYAAEEPSPGLEQRILTRVHTRKSWGWRWAFAVPAAASLAIGFWTLLPPAPQPLKIALTPPPAPVVAIPTPLLMAKPKPRTSPKQDQFPAPAPITREEQALLAFVTLHPEEAREGLIDWPKRLSEPIQIKEIEIDPLRADDSQ